MSNLIVAIEVELSKGGKIRRKCLLLDSQCGRVVEMTKLLLSSIRTFGWTHKILISSRGYL